MVNAVVRGDVMNIKEKIVEWQQAVKDRCLFSEEEAKLDKELELILFAIDTLQDKALKPDGKASDYGQGKVKYFNPVSIDIEALNLSPGFTSKEKG